MRVKSESRRPPSFLEAPRSLVLTVPAVRPQGTPQQIAEAEAQAYGNKARTKVHMLYGDVIETVLPIERVADLLSRQPDHLLLVPHRTPSGHIRAAFLRAGAIGWIEVVG